MWRQSRFRTFRAPRVCTCGHPAIAHYLRWDARQGCRLQCPCPQYKEAQRPSKYHAKKTEFNGNRYDSKFEAKVAADLEHQKRCGEIKEIRRQVDFPMVVNKIKICTYRADFFIERADGSKEVVEAKGLLLPVSRIKLRLFEALYPQIKLRMETQ